MLSTKYWSSDGVDCGMIARKLGASRPKMCSERYAGIKTAEKCDFTTEEEGAYSLWVSFSSFRHTEMFLHGPFDVED
jgi:hypothetical protein